MRDLKMVQNHIVQQKDGPRKGGRFLSENHPHLLALAASFEVVNPSRVLQVETLTYVHI